MDIFEVLRSISTQKELHMGEGMTEQNALTQAKDDVSKSFNINPKDIERLI